MNAMTVAAKPRHPVEETVFVEEFWDASTLGDVVTEITTMAQKQQHRFKEVGVVDSDGNEITQAELILITYPNGTERMVLELS